MEFDTDVLVVGAGPTGLALALDLARRRVAVRIIDRAPAGFSGSRAKGVQPRSLEVLEDLGLLDAVQAAGATYPPLGIHLGPVRLRKRMHKIAQPTDAVPHPNTWLIAQSATDAILRQGLARTGIQIGQDSGLVSLAQDADGVTAQIDGPLGRQSLRCRYVVGADGGSSAVRHQAGIAFPGKTEAGDRMIIADCRIEGLGRDHWHVWPWFGGRFAGACPLPGGDLFQVMIRLQPGEEPDLDPAALTARFRRQTGARRLSLTDIRWTSVFRPNIRLADRYRQGRVLLAGDAAHVHTPMGAQGLNTGLQDAYNLGWKLGQVLAGAPDALLDSYEQERRPMAARVLGLSTARFEALAKMDPAAIRRGKDEQQLSISYRTGPLGAAGRGLLEAGDRAPDARLCDATGQALRLFDILRGPHFTLLSHGTAAARELAAVPWPAGGASLRRVAVDAGPEALTDLATTDLAATDLNVPDLAVPDPTVPNLTVPDLTVPNLTVTDRDGSFASVYGLRGDMLMLIRPDGHIAQIAATDRPASIARAVTLMAPAQVTGEMG